MPPVDATGLAHTGRLLSETPGEEIRGLLRAETQGEYEVLAELGRGGMATVFLARELALNRKVAIKVMSPALVHGGDMVERFHREAQMAASLSHPNIIPIYSVRSSGGLFFFVMKCVEGRTLGSIIRELGQLPIDMVRAILAQVGGALDYAHRRGVVHRDIKPENIMIDDEGWTVVTDFGIAKATEATQLTATGAAIGTPAYMSPEQCSGDAVTGSADQYSLGVVAYEMLTGKPPFDAPTLMGMMWAHVNKAPAPLQERREDCPQELADAVERMLAKPAEERFPAMAEAVAAIGTTPVTQEDRVRTNLIHLAKEGEAARLIAAVRTPSSPVPLGRTGASAGRSPPPRLLTPRDAALTGRTQATERPTLVWVVIVLVAIGGGAVAWLLTQFAGPEPARPAPQVLELSTPGPPAIASRTIASIAIDAPATAIQVGNSTPLSAVARDAGGNTASLNELSWESSDPSVASVSPDGILSAMRAGIAQITARAESHSATVSIRFRGPRPGTTPGTRGAVVAYVQVVPPRARLPIGESLEIAAIPRAADGRILDKDPVVWESSHPAIAVVSPLGVVTGVGEGEARITATLEGRSAFATLSVLPIPSLEISPPQRPVTVGATVKLAARIRGPGGRFLEIPASWTSGNEEVATVSADGLVSGMAVGSAEIVATVRERSASVTVTVRDVEPVVVRAPPDARLALEAVVSEYARALSSRNVDAVKGVYPGLPANRERAWSDIFELGDLEVTVEFVEILEQSPDVAVVRFEQTIDGRRLVRNTTTFTASLVRVPDGWQITSIR